MIVWRSQSERLKIGQLLKFLIMDWVETEMVEQRELNVL